MPFQRQTPSLRKRFQRLSIRWSLIGLVLTVAVVFPSVVLIVKHAAERQVEVMATALSQSFRPMILQQQIREANLQMKDVVKLKSGESVTVLDDRFQPIFQDKENDETYCKTPNVACWSFGSTLVSFLVPIYFDDDGQELYGYLALKLHASVDWIEVIAICLLGGLIFLFQVRGISTAFQKESSRIERTLAYWKKLVDDPKLSEPPTEDQRLFSEFLPLHGSVRTLQSRVATLEATAAEAAATKAKINIVRGIGHDLKTPLSQLARFFALFVSNTETNGKVDSLEVERIEGILRRMGSLIRQVTQLDRRLEATARTNLSLWMKAYVNEIQADPEIIKTGTKIELNANDNDLIFSTMSEVDLFRLVDNLVRNAIESFPVTSDRKNRVTLTLEEIQGQPLISVADNGSGIPKHIQSRIFELDFTTKKTRGTGLGLGIVNKICKDAGLNLRFSSEEGVGTLFMIEFLNHDLPQEAAEIGTGIEGAV